MIRSTIRLAFALGLFALVGCGPAEEPVVEDMPAPDVAAPEAPGMPGESEAIPTPESAAPELDVPPAETEAPAPEAPQP